MSDAASAKALLDRYGLSARKSLGQHFLFDRNILLRIAGAADITPNDTIVEVGPGLGSLTRILLAKARRVIAVEKDEQMAGVVMEEMASEKLTVVIGDMLELAPEAVLKSQRARPPYKVVANLPYNVATAIIRAFLESGVRPTTLVVLVQREVAQNISAKPGDMSLLSVSTQLYAEPKIIDLVKPGSFYPPPKVESAILRLDVRPQPKVVPAKEMAAFFEVVRAGFSARRKQLANCLTRGLSLPRESVIAALGAANIAPERRAETLSLEEWGALYATLKRGGGV
ncbi:MAG: ribosomal RNA small subunit methyltransferase A [Chloroflexi bacterium]|nr:ribosomal RNA small subunit methyltransferase A [Chloroflexota bacterium]